MSRTPRNKCQRIEREIIELHRSLDGKSERVSLAGDQGGRGNL